MCPGANEFRHGSRAVVERNAIKAHFVLRPFAAPMTSRQAFSSVQRRLFSRSQLAGQMDDIVSPVLAKLSAQTLTGTVSSEIFQAATVSVLTISLDVSGMNRDLSERGYLPSRERRQRDIFTEGSIRNNETLSITVAKGTRLLIRSLRSRWTLRLGYAQLDVSHRLYQGALFTLEKSYEFW